MVTAIKLDRKVEVHSQLTSARDQSLAIASRTGRRMKYAAIKVNTNRNDSTVACSSLGSILVVALIIRLIGPVIDMPSLLPDAAPRHAAS